MTMDHPVFIAILAGLIVAMALVALTDSRRRRELPLDSPFDEEER